MYADSHWSLCQIGHNYAGPMSVAQSDPKWMELSQVNQCKSQKAAMIKKYVWNVNVWTLYY